MNYKTMLTVFVGLLVISSPVWAQVDSTATSTSTTSRPAPAPEPRVDIVGMYGYVWTVSRSATYNATTGDLDLKNSDYWGIAADIYAVPVMQFRLLYRSQNTPLTFKRPGGTIEELTDMKVEFWHLGVVKGMRRGNLRPFTSITIGGTNFKYEDQSDWKFSTILGLGAKIHFHPKIGLLLAGNAAVSFTDAFLGIGTGGLSLGGSGIWQFDLTAGLMLTL